MGVPGFFAWVLKNFRRRILKDQLNYNPEYLYIDANCLFHPQCFEVLAEMPDETDIELLEDRMIQRILDYLDALEMYVSPTTMMYIAVDGVAPMAKINQQRKRRFKSYLDKSIVDDIARRHGKPVASWSNAVITPGTEFMEKLHRRIKNHYMNKESHITYYYSSYHVPGEGEHKILQHIKANVDDDETCVIYGLDADLIFLSLACGKDIYLLREANNFFKEETATRLIYVSMKETKKAYNDKVLGIINQKLRPGKYPEDKYVDFIDDMVFICFLLGNDFLPHFLTLSIYKGGMDTIVDCYTNCFIRFGKNLTYWRRGHIYINNDFLLHLVDELAEREDEYIKSPIVHFQPVNPYTNDRYKSEIWEFEYMQKSYYREKKPYVGSILRETNGIPEDSVQEWKEEYYRYYMEDDVDRLVRLYFEGIVWTMRYYFEDCQSWSWFYPYDHAPFFSDIKELLRYDVNGIVFEDSGPINILAQLAIVVPPQHKHILPKNYRNISKHPEIMDLYPMSFKMDTLFKHRNWHCNPIIPIMEPERVINVIKDLKLTKEEKIRNNRSVVRVYNNL